MSRRKREHLIGLHRAALVHLGRAAFSSLLTNSPQERFDARAGTLWQTQALHQPSQHARPQRPVESSDSILELGRLNDGRHLRRRGRRRQGKVAWKGGDERAKEVGRGEERSEELRGEDILQVHVCAEGRTKRSAISLRWRESKEL